MIHALCDHVTNFACIVSLTYTLIQTCVFNTYAFKFVYTLFFRIGNGNDDAVISFNAINEMVCEWDDHRPGGRRALWCGWCICSDASCCVKTPEFTQQVATTKQTSGMYVAANGNGRWLDDVLFTILSISKFNG